VILQALPLPDSDGTCKIVLRPPKDDKNAEDERTRQALRQSNDRRHGRTRRHSRIIKHDTGSPAMAGHTHEPPVQHLAAFSSDHEGLTLNLLIQYSHEETFIHRVPLGDHHFNFCLVGHVCFHIWIL
jgi:hypothetical protein